MGYVAGIDGGGTSTTAVIADSDGKIVAKASSGPINLNAVEEKVIIQTLTGLMQNLRKQDTKAFEGITCLFAGVSGAGNDKAISKLQRMLQMIVPRHVSIRVEPDTINALYSGTYGAPGIVQIAGTGSITYGINRSGERDRTGGWGYLFGDEGSGYDIGRRGFTAALKAYDGRGRNTILLEMIQTYFGIANPIDLVQQIYASNAPKSEISPVSKLVFKAYQHGDTAASDIIADAADELNRSIRTLYGKLFAPGEKMDVVLCGGVFRDKDILPQLLESRLASIPQLTIVKPDIEPVGGSVLGGLSIKGYKIDKQIIRNIISTY